jgi:hypothetical protein
MAPSLTVLTEYLPSHRSARIVFDLPNLARVERDHEAF